MFDFPQPPHLAVCEHVQEQIVADRYSSGGWVYATGLSSATTPFTPAPSDALRFGQLWSTIRTSQEEGKLLELIADRRREIRALKEHWRPLINPSLPLHQEVGLAMRTGRMEVIEEGGGSTYLLIDEDEVPCYIIKPVDEDILCLNNYKYNASPYTHIFVRTGIPLYRSAQTDALAYEIALCLGIGAITPQTEMAILSSSQFYDLTDRAHPELREKLIAAAGEPDREKLCSIQRYLRHSDDFFSAIHEWEKKGNTVEEIGTWIDQEDFENILLFIWLIYDTDAHFGNIRIIPKPSFGPTQTYSLRKIDNGLSLPEKNQSLLNGFSYFPNADYLPSPRLRQLIAHIPIDKIEEKMMHYEMEPAIPAFKERAAVLQQLAQRDTLSLAEIDLRIRALELPDGIALALSTHSFQELKDLIDPSSM